MLRFRDVPVSRQPSAESVPVPCLIDGRVGHGPSTRASRARRPAHVSSDSRRRSLRRGLLARAGDTFFNGHGFQVLLTSRSYQRRARTLLAYGCETPAHGVAGSTPPLRGGLEEIPRAPKSHTRITGLSSTTASGRNRLSLPVARASREHGRLTSLCRWPLEALKPAAALPGDTGTHKRCPAGISFQTPRRASRRSRVRVGLLLAWLFR